MRWTKGGYRYVAKGLLQISGMGIRQKYIYISQFLLTIIFPIFALFSIGMGLVTFFASFFNPDLSFGSGLFYILLSGILLVISFVTMIIYTYPKYHSNPRICLSRKFILIGIFVIVYVIGVIFAIVSLNSIKDILRGEKEGEIFYKVDKSKVQLSDT